MIKLGWKVVSIMSDGSLISAFSAYALRYDFYKWTFPLVDCGPLAVFGTQKHAREFAHDSKDVRVVKCEYLTIPNTDAKCTLWWDRQTILSNYGSQLLFYAGTDNTTLLGKVPKGTIFAAGVRLIR